MNGISSLIKETQKRLACLSFLPSGDSARNYHQRGREPSPDTNFAGVLILDFSVYTAVRNVYIFIIYSVHGSLERLKTKIFKRNYGHAEERTVNSVW
jgi:hypothetical protein